VRAKPTFGTCAGCILLATKVENPKQAGLGALDITVRRNCLRTPDRQFHPRRRFLGEPIEMVFIRAPKIERVGEGVEVIATEGREDVPVMVRKGKTLAQTFHPELSDDRRIHQYFSGAGGEPESTRESNRRRFPDARMKGCEGALRQEEISCSGDAESRRQADQPASE